MKLRIKYVEGVGYFAQVKHFFWHKIGKHTDGYGLYPQDDLDHPLETEHDALERCKLYEIWKTNTDNAYVSYRYI